MTTQLTELIPEFNAIQDEDLRQRALAVWQEAMEIGGWTVDDLGQMPYTLLIEKVDITFAQHVKTVCRLCIVMEHVLKESYGDRYRIDKDTLIAGALLADVGKLMEFRKEGNKYKWASMYQYLRHPFTGVALCFKHGIPEAVMHVVATHSWEGDRFKRRPEAIIFHHADFTDFDLTSYR
jgi:predicted HD phosphohydrolase